MLKFIKSGEQQGGKPRLPQMSIGRFVIFLTLAVLLYLGVAAVGKAVQIYRLDQEERQIRGEIEELKARNEALQKQVEYLKSEAYVEKVAREELNLIKKGETAVIVLSPEGSAATAEKRPSENKESRQQPNWQRWWQFLFGE